MQYNLSNWQLTASLSNTILSPYISILYLIQHYMFYALDKIMLHYLRINKMKKDFRKYCIQDIDIKW